LSSLDDEASQTWNAAYQSRSCFALPQQKAVQPFALQYAAAVNVFMTELKLNDRIADQKMPFVAVTIRRLLNRNFQKAATDLQRFGVDIEAIYALEKTQIKVERTIFAPETAPEAMLAHFAAPTAEMTALVFGAKDLIASKSKSESNNTDENEIAKMQAFGHAFGSLVYILDALEDFDKDRENKEFNALRAAFATENLSIKDRLFVTNYLRKAEQTMTLALNDLPLSETAKADFAARISANLTLRLHQAARPYLSLKQSLSERIATEWNYRTATAKTLANQAFTNVSQEIFAPFAAAPIAVAHYASFGAIAFFLPQVAHSFSTQNKQNWSFAALGVATWLAFASAVGIIKKAKKTCSSPDNVAGLKAAKDCCDSGACSSCSDGDKQACCTGCCTCCCTACETSNSCDNCCTCCSQSNHCEQDNWVFALIVLAVIALLLGLAYIIIVLGK
jgi:Family of unknown function (DUF5685)